MLLGNGVAGWQNTKYILRLFGGKLPVARGYYREFVQKGVAAGRRRELTGGGLIRSIGGWSAAKLLRKAGALQKGDERILGDGEFVEKVLAQAKEAFERKYRLPKQQPAYLMLRLKKLASMSKAGLGALNNR